MCFFFNDTATTEIYTLSLHDALPICDRGRARHRDRGRRPPRSAAVVRSARGFAPGGVPARRDRAAGRHGAAWRSEEHTSELQSRQYLVCRLLLEKKTTHTLEESSYQP